MPSAPDPRPAGAYRALLPEARLSSTAQRAWTAADGALPALYLGHGAPPLLDEPDWTRRLLDWSLSMPKPAGIVVVSAHWESAPTAISATTAATPLVYDFGGFHPDYYKLRYPTPDATSLGDRVAAAMPDAHPVHRHPSRGLDHGAWVPLMVMYPLGDVPVVQLSLPTHDPAVLLDLGRRLAPLREEGVLVVGSGFLTHGLPYLTREALEGTRVPAWSRDFDAWAAQALAAGDVDTLAGYDRAPGVRYAHPTVEHLSPLFVTLGAGAAPDAPVRTAIDGYWWGLSRRSFSTAA